MKPAKPASRCPPPMGPGAKEVRGLLRGKRSRLLMLDYDGTLAPFRKERDEALPYPGVQEAVQSIAGHPSTRMVIVSGRAVSDLLPLLRFRPLPEIWGAHGWERRRANGDYQVGPFPDACLRGLEKADAWMASLGFEGCCEKKPGSVALHVRAFGPETARETEERTLRGWKTIAEDYGLEIQRFDGGIEMRVPGRSKGDAVRTLLAESGPHTAAAYLGDDATDEDAFVALGSRGLSVLVRPEPRESRADIWIRPPEGLLSFLAPWRR
jgi:trehalose 6-phosphate phosphatase